jgi:Cu+-exporting ATPase
MATVTKRFTTTGMHCPSCSMLIQMDVSDLPGVSAVSANHQTGMTEVTYEDQTVTADEIVDAIAKAGYGAELADE